MKTKNHATSQKSVGELFLTDALTVIAFSSLAASEMFNLSAGFFWPYAQHDFIGEREHKRALFVFACFGQRFVGEEVCQNDVLWFREMRVNWERREGLQMLLKTHPNGEVCKN